MLLERSPLVPSRLWAWVRERPRGAVLVAGLLVVTGAWVATRPAGESGRSVGHTVSGFFQAQRDEDCRRLVDLLTEASWSQDGEWSRGEFLERCADAVDGYETVVYQPLVRRPGAELEVDIVDDEGLPSDDGDRAVVRAYSNTIDDESSEREGRLVREDGEWRVETDPHVLRIGRSVDDTVRGYMEAYNQGDCERMLDHVSGASWSQDGQASQDEFLQGCRDRADASQASGQLPVVVADMEVTDEDDEQATADVNLASAANPGSYSPSDADHVSLVREGLEWTLDFGEPPPGGAARTPFPTVGYFELQTLLLDELPMPDETCFDYSDDPGTGTDGSTTVIEREYFCDAALTSVTLFRFGSDEEARSAADRLATGILEDPPPTAEELAENGSETDPAVLAEVAASYRPNQAAAVPGMPEARGVLTSCDVEGCDAPVVFAVRNGVLVEVGFRYGAGIDAAAAALRAQLERL